MYELREVDGTACSDTLTYLNSLIPEWPDLLPKHFENGFWWLVFFGGEAVGFAGMVPMSPFPDIGYLKRCYVAPDHHGHGLQYRLMVARIAKARQLCWTHIVSECSADNSYSANNFRRAGFELCEPEQPWAKDALYWKKELL